jgi:CHAT domain-containing protein
MVMLRKLTTSFFYISIPLIQFKALGAAQDTTNGASLLASARYYAQRYNWTKAASYFSRAATVFDASGDKRNALYAKIGFLRGTMETADLSQLSAYLHQQLENPLVASDDRLKLFCFAAKGDVDAEIDSAPAQADWEQVAKLAHKLHDRHLESRAQGEIGFHRFVQADYSAARKLTAGSLLYARDSGDYSAEIRFLSGIGTGLALTRTPEQGIEYTDKALELAKQHPETGYPYMAVAGEIMALIRLRKIADAKPLIADLKRQAIADGRWVKWTQAQLFASDVAVLEGNREEAIRILTGTIRAAERNRTRLLTDIYDKLTNLYRQTGQLGAAEHAAAEAVKASGHSKDMYLLPSRLASLAELELSFKRAREAHDLYARATDDVEGMLTQTPEAITREALLTEMSDLYEREFVLAAEQYNVAEALSTIERVRGRIVAEMLRNIGDRSRLVGELNPALEDQITNLKLQLAKAISPDQRRALEDRLFYAKQSRWTTDSTNEEIVKLRNQAITIRQVQAILAPKEALLEFVLAAPDSYCLVITRSSASLVRLAPREQIETAVRAYLDQIGKQEPAAEKAKELQRLLFDPIPALADYSQLTIVPDGVLHLLPFDALSDPSSTYAVERWTISYTPSAGSEFLLRTRKRPVAARPFFGVGGVLYSRGGSSNMSAKGSVPRGAEAREFPDNLSSLPNLPHSAEEVRTASHLLGGDPASLQIAEHATSEAFSQADLTEYKVIHFAVHAIVDLDRPEDSALLIGSFPSMTFLGPRDILQFHLNSELVVLSACDTGVGRLQGQEGSWNLARSFLMAGSNSVVSTLWPVDDSYSASLIENFYTHLSQGMDKARALQTAKTDILRQFGHDTPPYDWAGFLLLGDGIQPLSSSSPNH